jgi:hypothetical protein
MKERIFVPALQPCIIEPIWQQFSSMLPEREVEHPLGCHRPRIPDQIVFEKLVEVFGFRLRLLENRRRIVLGYHLASKA